MQNHRVFCIDFYIEEIEFEKNNVVNDQCGWCWVRGTELWNVK